MRVLVVEDHEPLAETVAVGLRREGMAVDVALDGAVALDKANANRYDVVVLDRDLPGVHGDDVCAALVLVAGGLLLAVTYVLAAHSSLPGLPDTPEPPDVTVTVPDLGGTGGPAPPDVVEPRAPAPDAWALATEAQEDADRRRLLVGSLLGLALMAVAATGLGWFVAGSVLRPVATMTATVRRMSADDLGRRLAAPGPDDELKELADTFDQLLDRLEAAFDSQRLFVANASHELRTPLTFQRALLEVALAAPGADAASLRAACDGVLDAGRDQERLIDALLALARGQRGLDRRERVDLGAVATRVVEARGDAAAARGLRTTLAATPAPLAGDPELVERLVVNLVDNAVAHNVPGGWVEVTTATTADGRATLRVANGGAPIPPERVSALFEPFHRLGPARTGGGGHGLGLSIVDAVATAHAATLDAAPLPDGGLAITVTFPPP